VLPGAELQTSSSVAGRDISCTYLVGWLRCRGWFWIDEKCPIPEDLFVDLLHGRFARAHTRTAVTAWLASWFVLLAAPRSRIAERVCSWRRALARHWWFSILLLLLCHQSRHPVSREHAVAATVQLGPWKLVKMKVRRDRDAVGSTLGPQLAPLQGRSWLQRLVSAYSSWWGHIGPRRRTAVTAAAFRFFALTGGVVTV